MLLISGDGAIWMRDALRRSEAERDGSLQARNRECCSWFRQFAADLQEIASSGSVNAVPVLGFCKQFARMVLFLMDFREPL